MFKRLPLGVAVLLCCTVSSLAQKIETQVIEDVETVVLVSAKHEQRIQNRRHAQNTPENELEKMWALGKKEANKLGLDIGVDISYLAQRA
ncbi:MAG: hypothetical protein IJ266_03210, partial [Elusimicrobiaceae bacterium]|nr:hypothetical protein [Elusimicrobiaceae bacterium]